MAKNTFLYVESVDSAVEQPDLKFVNFGLENAICCFIEFSKMCDIKRVGCMCVSGVQFGRNWPKKHFCMLKVWIVL